MKNSLDKNRISQLTINITVFILIIALYFMSILYFSIQNSRNQIKKDLNGRLDYIESYLNEKFLDYKIILYNTANSFSKKLVYTNKEFMDELSNVFLYKAEYSLTLPISGFAFINEDVGIISGEDLRGNLAKYDHIKKMPEYVLESKKEPFKINLLNIIYGSFIKELIIPITISVYDGDKYIGIIWTGIKIKDLNQQLTLRFGNNEHFGSITLLNNKNHIPKGNYIFNQLDDTLSFVNILKYLIKNEQLILNKNLKDYPFSIELEIKSQYLKSFLGINILLNIVYLIILIIAIFLLYIIINNYYKAPLLLVYKKLAFMNKTSKEILMLSDNSLLISKFDPNEFAEDISSLLDHYYLLQKDSYNRSDLVIRKKILDLALTEQHFLSSKKNTISSEEKLYLNKLLSYIEEDSRTISLLQYLTEVNNYCCEFYHEINCKIIVGKKDDKSFVAKYTALTETIFNIFTFIIRGNFDIYNKAITIKGSFVKGNNFPLIIIEAYISNDKSSTLGWSAGPSYVCSGLLSIHLLAKENNMILNLKKKENKILFILEPINSKIEFYEQAF